MHFYLKVIPTRMADTIVGRMYCTAVASERPLAVLYGHRHFGLLHNNSSNWYILARVAINKNDSIHLFPFIHHSTKNCF